MESINVGVLSILPPIIAITLALITKEVISSLIIGIISGTFIYSMHTTTGFINIIINTIDTTVKLMSTKFADNVNIVMFLCFLGILVVVVTKAGGSKAYGDWAAKKIPSRGGAKIATSILGILIFIDDYFNCLTVGTVMRPVTDKYKISHAKLAYLIDATAAPICIIAPVSSWAASVISQISDTGLNGMETFVSAIPYNLYALLTLMMVAILSLTKLDFGPMLECELEAMENNNLDHTKNGATSSSSSDELSNLKISNKGTVWDLILPIMALIVTSIFSMLYVGGYYSKEMSIADAFGNTDAGAALALSGFVTIAITFLLLIPRKVITFSEFMEGVGEGVKSMVGAIIILVLAWSTGGVCRDLLSTGVYVSDIVQQSNIAVELIPTIIFIVAGFLSFSMGTSWGTFGILIPIVVTICASVAPHLTIISLSATLAGSVFGDHCSPISDTTILSSVGASCNHMDHVTTQTPYACVVGACSIVGYIIAGTTTNLALTLIVSTGLLIASIIVLNKVCSVKRVKS